MSDDFWPRIERLIDRKIKERAAYIGFAAAQSGGKTKIKRVGEAAAGDELYAMAEGIPAFTTDDELVILNVGGRDFAIAKSQRSSKTSITYDKQIIAPSFNSPYREAPIVQNSADTASNASTVNYAVNVDNPSFDLPSGTWDVIAWGDGIYYHSSANGVVRVRMLIAADQGTALTMACPADPSRATIPIANYAGGLSGSIAIEMGYRPNSSGTANAGGGWVMALGFRSS